MRWRPLLRAEDYQIIVRDGQGSIKNVAYDSKTAKANVMILSENQKTHKVPINILPWVLFANATAPDPAARVWTGLTSAGAGTDNCQNWTLNKQASAAIGNPLETHEKFFYDTSVSCDQQQHHVYCIGQIQSGTPIRGNSADNNPNSPLDPDSPAAGGYYIS